MKIRVGRLRAIVRRVLAEGGLKVPVGRRHDLVPTLVRQAARSYERFLAGWNAWLHEQGVEPVRPVRLSGSATHAAADEVDRPDATYGDIDYLVELPVDAAQGDRRAGQAASLRRYTELMARYLRDEAPDDVDVDLTLGTKRSGGAGSDPLSVILRMPDDVLVQVDTVVTYPHSAEWATGRYTPERGIKGYVTGNLYAALGDFLTLSIGGEGVLARYRGKERVPARFRSGVDVRTVSTNFRTFMADIAEHLLGPGYTPDPVLRRRPGLDPDNVTVTDLAQGIVGLANTLDAAGMYDRDEMLGQILRTFEAGLAENVDKKAGRDLSPDKERALRRLNDQQLERVRRVFGMP